MNAFTGAQWILFVLVAIAVLTLLAIIGFFLVLGYFQSRLHDGPRKRRRDA